LLLIVTIVTWFQLFHILRSDLNARVSKEKKLSALETLLTSVGGQATVF